MQQDFLKFSLSTVFSKRAHKSTIGAFSNAAGEFVMDTETKNRLSLASIGMAVCICATAPAWGDQAEDQGADTSESGGLSEIVVTARKASEPLQTTPVAVTALSQASLTQNQIVEVSDLQHATPDMAIGGAGTGPSSIVYLAIRGEAQNSPNSASDNAVGIYIDGVYIGRPVIGNQGFLDIGQVEVLRGPQGTLFGRNTTGGALNITTNHPTDNFEGYVKAGYGNFDSKLGEAVVNVPLVSGTLDARVAVRFDDHDSYYTNPLNSAYDPADLKHDWQARAQLRWTPSSVPLTIDWSYDYADQRDTGTPTALTGFNAGSGVLGPMLPPLGVIVGLAGVNPSKYLVNPNSSSNPNYRFSYGGVPTNADNPAANINTPMNQNRAVGLSQNLDLDVGTVHVKSITAYRESGTSNAESLSGMPLNYYAFFSQYTQHQFSEELQLSGKAGKFDWIGGAYYFQEGGTELSASQAFGFLTPVFNEVFGIPVGPQPVNTNFSIFDSRSIAGFGQTNYHFTDTIRATLGYRYTWDQRSIDQGGRNDIYGANLCAVGITNGTPLAAYPNQCQNPFTANFSYPAWTAGLDWEVLPDTFVYVKTDRASMAGGFNTRPVPITVSPAFQPESNTDVELGLKSDIFDHHLRTNLALFHGWQNDVQRIVNTVVEVNGAPEVTQYQTNSGKTTTYGVELEIKAIPWTGMELSASGAYLHAAYESGTFHELQELPSGQVVSVDRSNEPVPQAPKYTFSAGATQFVPLAIGKLSFHVDYAWIDKDVITQDTASRLQPAAVQAQYATQNALGILPSYGLVNARIALDLDNPDMEVAFWGRNLANKEYYQQQFDSYASLGVAENFQGDPRTFGFTVTYRFK
jgi:iron complex outermembrane receptor protein